MLPPAGGIVADGRTEAWEGRGRSMKALIHEGAEVVAVVDRPVD